jgi:hypothetical protein
VPGVPEPDYPAAPAWDEPIRLPVFIREFFVSPVMPLEGAIGQAPLPAATDGWKKMKVSGGFLNLRNVLEKETGVIYAKGSFNSETAGSGQFGFGSDGPSRIWVNGAEAGVFPDMTNPANADKVTVPVTLRKGKNEVVVALDNRGGNAWGIYARFANQ